MADLDVSDPTGVVDIRRGRGLSGSHQMTEIANLTSVSAMKARLTALSPTTWTPARLSTMTENDMLYAIRQHTSDVAGVK